MEKDRGRMDAENVLTLPPQDEIVSLHNQIENAMARSLQNGLRIGEILTQQKAELEHGRFVPWIAENLPFSERTARNYMMLHTRRDEIKTASVAGLNAAYRLLSTPMTAGKLVEPPANAENSPVLSPAQRFEAACDKYKHFAFRRKDPDDSHSRLEELKDRIDKHLPAAIKTARALNVIRDKNLWQAEHSSWNEFCLANFGVPAEYADALGGLLRTIEEAPQ